MTQFILASASIGREFLLKGLKIPYQTMPSKIDEDKIMGKNPLQTIKMRAKVKGEKVAKKFYGSSVRLFDCLILSADTEVIINDQLLGKPKNYKDAARMLKMLSGKTHEVISSFYLIRLISPISQIGTIWQDYDRSFVTFRKLTNNDIKLYLSITDYTRYTGSYALVASPQNFITKIEGSISNVIGLPLEKVIPILRENNLLTYS